MPSTIWAVYINYSRNDAPTDWPEVAERGPIHNKKTVESRHSTILQPIQVSMGLNSHDLQHFEHATRIASRA